MPHSHPYGKDWAADIYAVVHPEAVIDIGPGAGMWSDALRPRHRSHWTGVEIWEPYVESYNLREKYDDIVIGDVRDYDYDRGADRITLVILGDVLEHMTQDEAVGVLQKFATTRTHILVSVPIVHYEQGALEGNPHETHLWHPTHEWAMDTMKPDAYVKGDVVGAYWSAP
jgi:hypothetical protein